MVKSLTIKIIICFFILCTIFFVYNLFKLISSVKNDAQGVVKFFNGDKRLIKSSKSKNFYKSGDKIFLRQRKILPLGLIPIPIVTYHELVGIESESFEIISAAFTKDKSQIFYSTQKVMDYTSDQKIQLLQNSYLQVGRSTLHNGKIISTDEKFKVLDFGFTRDKSQLFMKNVLVENLEVSEDLKVVSKSLINDRDLFYFIGKEDDMRNGKLQAYVFPKGEKINNLKLLGENGALSEYFFKGRNSFFYRTFKLNIENRNLKILNERTFYNDNQVYTLINEKKTISKSLNKGFDLIFLDDRSYSSRFFLSSPRFNQIKSVEILPKQGSFNRLFLVSDNDGVFLLNSLGSLNKANLVQKISDISSNFDSFDLKGKILTILNQKYYFEDAKGELVSFKGDVEIRENYVKDLAGVYTNSYKINLISALNSNKTVFYENYAFDNKSLFNYGHFVSELYPGDYEKLSLNPALIKKMEIYEKRNQVLIDNIEYRLDAFENVYSNSSKKNEVGQLAISNLSQNNVVFSKNQLDGFTLRTDDGERVPLLLEARHYPVTIGPGENTLIPILGSFNLKKDQIREFGIIMYDFVDRKKSDSLNVNNESIRSLKGSIR